MQNGQIIIKYAPGGRKGWSEIQVRQNVRDAFGFSPRQAFTPDQVAEALAFARESALATGMPVWYDGPFEEGERSDEEIVRLIERRKAQDWALT